MVLTLRALNDDATLNNWAAQGSSQAVRGADAKLIFQLWQVDRKIRYVPTSGATITVDLLKNDGTILTKTATYPFVDDRSIIQFTLSEAETAVLISQNLVVKIAEGSDTTFAILQQGLQVIPTSQVGC